MIDRKFTLASIVGVAIGFGFLPLTGQTRTLVISKVNLVDVVDGRVTPNTTVIINGPSITAVQSAGTPPAGAQLIDAQGKYLIPGLWDMHAHTQATAESSLQLAVVNGIVGIRDMGSDLDFILSMREATQSGRIVGPR